MKVIQRGIIYILIIGALHWARNKQANNESLIQTGELGCPSELWPWCLLLSILFRLRISLISLSLLSTKVIKSLKLTERRVRLLGRIDSGSLISWSSGSGSYLRNWQYTLQKNAIRARKQATAHMRNRPQKLLSESWVSSDWLFCEEHPFLDSHLSWILWSSPFSDSWRIAVDRSTARGESLWNAWPWIVKIS